MQTVNIPAFSDYKMEEKNHSNWMQHEATKKGLSIPKMTS